MHFTWKSQDDCSVLVRVAASFTIELPKSESLLNKTS